MNILSEIFVNKTPPSGPDNKTDAIKLIELAIAEALNQQETQLEIIRDVLAQVELTKSVSG